MLNITTEEKKQIVAALQEAIDKEMLMKMEAAWYLNIHPNYITWALNEKYWSAISERWNRLQEWYKSREKLSDFQLPEGEERTDEKPEVKRQIDHSSAADKVTPAPEKVRSMPDEYPGLSNKPEPVKEKRHYKARKPAEEKPSKDLMREIADLRQKVAFLEASLKNLAWTEVETSKSQIAEIMKPLAERVSALENKPAEVMTVRPERFILFQRNVYPRK